MIPVAHTGSALRRTGDPFVATIGDRKRRLIDGRVVTRPSTLRHVPVRCACGTEYSVELRKWLRSPPSRCIHCHITRIRRSRHRRQP